MSVVRRAAFEDFVRAEASSLFHSAYLLVGNRPGAEDLPQDAIERTYRRWGSTAIDEPAAYVRRAMANLASNQWRWRRRYLTTTAPPASTGRPRWVSSSAWTSTPRSSTSWPR